MSCERINASSSFYDMQHMTDIIQVTQSFIFCLDVKQKDAELPHRDAPRLWLFLLHI